MANRNGCGQTSMVADELYNVEQNKSKDEQQNTTPTPTPTPPTTTNKRCDEEKQGSQKQRSDEVLLRMNTSSLSSRQMDSLTAICDTLLPSIHIHHPRGTTTTNNNDNVDVHSLYTFYKTSASMAATPQHIGGFMGERFKHPALGILRMGLWMLSTWVGTFVLCGRRSLKTQFPYLQRFSQVSPKKREEILRGWWSS